MSGIFDFVFYIKFDLKTSRKSNVLVASGVLGPCGMVCRFPPI